MKDLMKRRKNDGEAAYVFVLNCKCFVLVNQW